VVEIRVWNAETSNLVRALPMPTDERGKGTVLSLRFFPDGKRLLANCEMPAHGVQILDQTIHIREVTTGREVARIAAETRNGTTTATTRFACGGCRCSKITRRSDEWANARCRHVGQIGLHDQQLATATVTVT
jgi:hypothetical protein